MKSILYRLTFISSLLIFAIFNRFKPGYIPSMLFYILALILLWEVISVIYTNYFIRFDSSVDKRTTIKGGNITYNFVVENSSFLMLCPIQLSYLSDGLLFSQQKAINQMTYYLLPYEKKQIKKEINCQYRGSYDVGVNRITIKGFFGLIQFSITNIESHKILVYPNINNLVKYKFKQTSSENPNSVVELNRFNNNVFFDVKDYEQGDSLAKIHWKLSARRGELISKDYEGNISNTSKIFINNHTSDFGRYENIFIEDYIVEGVVALVKYFLDGFSDVELFWNDGKYNKSLKGNKKKDFSRFYKGLALMKFNRNNRGVFQSLECGTRSQENSLLIMVTAFISEAFCEAVINKKRQGFEIVVVVFESNLEAFSEQLDQSNRRLISNLMMVGIDVKRFVFETGYCRLDVIL